MAAFLKEGQMKISLPKGGEKLYGPGDDLEGVISAERIASLKKHGLVVDKNPLDSQQIVEKAVRAARVRPPKNQDQAESDIPDEKENNDSGLNGGSEE